MLSVLARNCASTLSAARPPTRRHLLFRWNIPMIKRLLIILCFLALVAASSDVPEFVTRAVFDTHTHQASDLITTNMVKSAWFGAGGISTDGTFCLAAAEDTIASQPLTWTVTCQDHNDATMYGNMRMPDAWNGGTLTFTAVYLQRQANTGALVGHIMAQCRGPGEVVSGWGTEVAI